LPVLDRLQRPLRDLRISVTDRCNFRCVYCMPREVFGPQHKFMPRHEILSFEELARVAGAAAELGVEKIRLTGGEPLLRTELPQLIELLTAIPGVQDIALTTNGSQLARHAEALKAAGLKRVTVSLDALDPDVFRRITDVKVEPSAVHEGIEAATRAGLGVKINMVVKRGLNEEQILPMAGHFRNSGHVLRFIEFMDVGASNHWQKQQVITAAELRRMIDARWPLGAVDPNYTGEVAKRYRYRDGGGEIGFITSISQPFCGDCSRLRLSAEGRLYTCLFARKGFDVRGLLRQGIADDELQERIGKIWMQRADRYSELRSKARASAGDDRIEMSYIGG